MSLLLGTGETVGRHQGPDGAGDRHRPLRPGGNIALRPRGGETARRTRDGSFQPSLAAAQPTSGSPCKSSSPGLLQVTCTAAPSGNPCRRKSPVRPPGARLASPVVLLLFTGNPLAGPPKVLAGVASIPASAGIQEAARVCRLSRRPGHPGSGLAGTTKRTLSPINARAPVYWFSSPGLPWVEGGAATPPAGAAWDGLPQGQTRPPGRRAAPPANAAVQPSVSATTVMGKEPMNISAAETYQMLITRPETPAAPRVAVPWCPSGRCCPSRQSTVFPMIARTRGTRPGRTAIRRIERCSPLEANSYAGNSPGTPG